MRKKKLLLVTQDVKLLTSTLEASNLVSELSKRFKVKIVLMGQFNSEFIPTADAEVLRYEDTYRNWMLSRHIFILFCLQNLTKKGFKSRAVREIFGPFSLESWRGVRKNLKRILNPEFLWFVLDFLFSQVTFFRNAYSKFLLEQIKTPSVLKTQLSDPNLKVVLLLSSGYDPMVYQIEKEKPKAKFQSFLLVNNWDNLTTKSSPPLSLDGLLLWNNQQIKHALDMGFEESKLSVVGSAKLRIGETGQCLQSSKCKILYVGQQNCHNEELDLVLLSSFLRQKVALLYRPHPARRNDVDVLYRRQFSTKVRKSGEQDLFEIYNSQNHGDSLCSVQMDVSAEVQFSKYCMFVGPPTTLLLEAYANGCPVVVLAIHDGESRISGFRMWNDYSHFSEFKNLPGVIEVQSIQDAARILETHSEVQRPILGKEIDELVPQFACSFGERVTKAITKNLLLFPNS